MDYKAIVATLGRVENISDFARVSQLPRRTLVRLISGESNPSVRTCEQVAEALERHKPALRPLEPERAAA